MAAKSLKLGDTARSRRPGWARVAAGLVLAGSGALCAGWIAASAAASPWQLAPASPPRLRLRPAPTPTVTPTPPPPTPTPRPNVNLAFVTPDGWPGCVVCNFRWRTPPLYEFLSIVHPTHVVWAVTSGGPSSVFGPIDFALLLDGERFLTVRYDNRGGFLPGTALGLHIETRVTARGRHTLTVMVDPDQAIAETNEADNACSFTGVWTADPVTWLPAAVVEGPAAPPSLAVIPLGHP